MRNLPFPLSFYPMKIFKRLIVFVSVFSFLAIALICAENGISETPQNPYGICAHIAKNEYPVYRKAIDTMEAVGIGTFRSGANWINAEKTKGKFDFSRWESLISYAEKKGIEPLVIFPSNTPNFAKPFPKHIDELAEVCKRFAGHFKDKMKYFEVVNEPNLKIFWDGEEPDARAYANLLKRVSTAIKEGNPRAKVLYSGVAGTPVEFIEESFKAGAGEYFDIMNFHPYSWYDIPEKTLLANIEKVKGLMHKYGIEDKPVWITEFGYTSAQAHPSIPKYVAKSLKILGVDKAKGKIAYIHDERFAYFGNLFNGSAEWLFPQAKNFHRINFDEIKNLSPSDCPVLYILPNEIFPKKYRSDLLEYVKKGGTLVTVGGIPFYYDTEGLENGKAKRKVAGRSPLKAFRMGVKTFKDYGFVEPNLVKMRIHPGRRVAKTESAEGFSDIKCEGYFPPYFISTENTTPDDEVIPIVYGVFGDKKLPLGAIYKLGGEFKGNIIAFYGILGESASEQMQAKMLPRQFILARSRGIERVFKYCLISDAFDYTRESHFGIVGKNLEPKPSYYAYKTLAETLGNSLPEYRSCGNINIAEWSREKDGMPVAAIWSNYYKQPVNIKFEGKIISAKNYIGEKVGIAAEGQTLSLDADMGVLYLEGVKNVEICKSE